VTDDRKEAAASGECAISGVPGTGAEIKLAFLDPADSKTGALRPTGNVVDMLDGIEASCTDTANPCIFIGAADLGVTGTELPDEISNNIPLLRRLEDSRRFGARSMKLCKEIQHAPRAVSKIARVSKAAKHRVLSGEVDIVARVMSDGQPHRSIPLTAASCTGVAAPLKGSVEEALLAPKRVEDGVLTRQLGVRVELVKLVRTRTKRATYAQPPCSAQRDH